MFKALLLQSWHNLSDPGLEKQLARELLFRRFVELSLADSVPDYSTIWRFRQLLEKQDLMGTLLSEVNRQLSHQCLYIRSGEISMVDVSVIQIQHSRPNKGKGGNSTQVPEADYSVNRVLKVSLKPAMVIRHTLLWTKAVSLKPLHSQRGTCLISITLHSYSLAMSRRCMPTAPPKVKSMMTGLLITASTIA
jgi:IS5 family transposase